MAKLQINTKSSSYLRDKEVFLKDLKQFNESKNLPFKTPIVNGIEIDLYHFYTLVQHLGGLNKVNQNNTWDDLLRPLRLPYPCINGSTLLRRLYGTYCEKYEKAKGPPGRDDDNDMEEDSRSRRGGIPRITFSGGTYISASGEALRTGTRVAGPSERLALSLLSPMPNEQDFAVNVCTVLAADHSNRLPLSTTPHILDFLLAHAGVYNHASLRDTIGRSYFEARGRSPDDFWRLRAGGGGAKELADETKFQQPGLEQPELSVQALAAHNALTDCLMQSTEEEKEAIENVINEEVLEDWVTEPTDESQLFAPELPGGASCVYTQRVLQIASIVRSLSFHEENVQYLAKNTTLIRFLLLCANCWVGTLRQSGLDTLGNISTELIIKDPATCLISRHILSTIQSALVSPDRARVLAALELLNKLAQNEANEDALLKALEAKVYSDVCALLTLRDIMVLVCTLECVYALTSLGDRAGEAVARVPGLVHTLVSLVTVEAQSYGPRACILMRVVETVSGPSALAAAAAEKEAQEKQQQQTQQLNQSQPQVVLQQQVPLSAPKPAPPEPAPTPAPAPSVAPPISTLQQSHMQQKTAQENEHFAQAWLRSTFAPLPASDNSALACAELYRQYLACCGKLGRKGVIAPNHFPRLVRTVFGGTVGPNNITTSTGETQQVYVGIRAKNAPPKPTTPQGPASPILKAQLTNKPGQDVKPVVSQAQPQQQQQPTHPHLSQALEAGTSNTSLIKHLLAHKVSPAAPPQVAQRQQNQQRVGSSSVVGQPSQSAMEVDPEALIKCTTITSGGVASSTPAIQEKFDTKLVESERNIGTPLKRKFQEDIRVTSKRIRQEGQVDSYATTSHHVLHNASLIQVIISAPEDLIVPKEEPVQIQIDEQSQLTIKTAQNKMLADLLEKKSNPPVQVVQMGPQINAPTIQITETGQIVQVKSDPSPVIQINDQGVIAQAGPYFQIKNEHGQIIQIKNEQGQIIHLKSDQLQAPMIQIKNDGQIIQGGQIMQQSVIQGMVKTEKDQLVETVVADHSYVEPPNKRQKLDEKRESNRSPQESVSKTAANLYAALAASALEDEDDLMPPKQEPVDVMQQTSVLVTGSGDNVIIQEPILQVQQPTMQVQQPTLQVQQPTIQVQAPTLQVQQPMLQVQPMDVQNIIASQAGQIIIQEKSMQSQTQFVQQPMQIIATPSTSQGGIGYITQNIPGNMMQKTIIIVQGTGGGPLTLTVNNPAGLDEATLNSLIAQATEAITQQQIIQNSGVIQSTQRVIVTQPALVSTSQPITMVKTAVHQVNTSNMNAPQITPSQQPIITTQPQPHKAQIVNQQQMVVTQKQPPALINTTNNQIVGNQQLIQGNQQMMQGNQQMMQGNQQMIQGNQQMIQGNQQMIHGNQQMIQGNQQMLQGNQIISVSAVSNNQQIIMNAPLKSGVHRVVQSQRGQVVTQAVNQATVVQTDSKTSVIQSPKPHQPAMRQVITRQPVMLGNTKIGDKEMIVTQPVIEQKPPTPKPAATPPPQHQPPPQAQDETPWICHWRGCGKTFESSTEVFTHAAKTHCPNTAGGEAPCLWLECDRVPRRTFALLNHLTDKHCTPQALKAIFNSRRHVTAEAESNRPQSLGYPPNAALAALNKHATETFNPRELMDENEGPVTKSIRLTAALILRNIVIYSNTGRRQLRSYEAHLASIALSTVEASRTIAQVLYDMNNI